jgi:tetratricopeptide (TPR) repeat protein
MTGRLTRHSQKATIRTASADRALRVGMAALNQQRVADAERIARDVLDRQPQHPAALHLLGLVLLAQKRPRDAVAPLEQAALISADAVVETHYALALRDLGRKTEAVDWLRRATIRDPPFPAALHELGILLCSLRRYIEAEAVLKRGLEVAPELAELSVELGGVYI